MKRSKMVKMEKPHEEFCEIGGIDDLRLSSEDEKLIDEAFSSFEENEETVEHSEPPSEDSKNESNVIDDSRSSKTPKMCERKDFILIDLMNSNCIRLADLMTSMNSITEKVINLNVNDLSDEEYHKLLTSADNINKLLVKLSTMI